MGSLIARDNRDRAWVTRHKSAENCIFLLISGASYLPPHRLRQGEKREEGFVAAAAVAKETGKKAVTRRALARRRAACPRAAA